MTPKRPEIQAGHPQQDRLVAYVDGELDIDEREAVQALIAGDCHAAAIVERLIASRDQAEGAFGAILAAPQPPHLLAAIETADAPASAPDWRARLGRLTHSRTWRLAVAPAALVATLLLSVVVATTPRDESGFTLASGGGLDIPAEVQPALPGLLDAGGGERQGRLAGGGAWRLFAAPAATPAAQDCFVVAFAGDALPRSAGLACPAEAGWRIATIALDPAP
ncbi:MAG: hypothetical protein RLO50_16840 [Azospirillaceae bacterium]